MKDAEMKDQDESDHSDPADNVRVLRRSHSRNREQENDAEREPSGCRDPFDLDTAGSLR